MYETDEQIFEEGMPKRFNGTADGEHASFQFNIIGGNTWSVVIDNGKLFVQKGSLDSPNCVLTLSLQDCLDMANGREGIQMLYMTGKLKVEGDLPFAIKLARYFPAEK